MTFKEIYNVLFTEHPKVGYSPAILTLAACAALSALLLYGGVSMGKMYFGSKPAIAAPRG